MFKIVQCPERVSRSPSYTPARYLPITKHGGGCIPQSGTQYTLGTYTATTEVYNAVTDELLRRNGKVTVYTRRVPPSMKNHPCWIVEMWGESMIRRTPDLYVERIYQTQSKELWIIEFTTKGKQNEKNTFTDNRRENEQEWKQTRFAL